MALLKPRLNQYYKFLKTFQHVTCNNHNFGALAKYFKISYSEQITFETEQQNKVSYVANFLPSLETYNKSENKMN